MPASGEETMSETKDQAATTAGATLASMLIQGQQAQALIVAAQLGIADQLADGPRRAEELAAAIGAHSARAVPAAACARQPRGVCHPRRWALRADAPRRAAAHRRSRLAACRGTVFSRRSAGLERAAP